MNKQQLAAKIWATANNLRSKIDANEYKDYILGFIFYKFLSEREEQLFKSEGWTDEDLKDLVDEEVNSNIETSNPTAFASLSQEQKNHIRYQKHCQEKLGYFIPYKNLYSTWLKKGEKKEFDQSNVSTALAAFNDRLIYKTHEKVFNNIFHTLQTELSKLGGTKAILDLLELIKDIPMDGRQDYDVLGFIYEYLISNFAANAGKKAGEFYTPHEASLIMSEIIAYELKNKEKIEIYDPTSGSGSLLINIGTTISKYLPDKNKIKYYAQELKENTFNLTRMNLVMRGILPDNIIVRNGDTLLDDWPYFDENDKDNTYEPLYVDAVVSNPPYSQKWAPKNDARFDKYGLAPKSKADYAFLLHDLYHLKPDGIMTIVLPHGVLFRGDPESEDGEGVIRKNLIENNNIDTIISLPPNIFFGTTIPTIIMVLKQKRLNDDILIIDASKGYIKDGKKNKLRACDIKKILDTYIDRKDEIPFFSRKVSRNEIRKNNYNLNISRYVDSNKKTFTHDIYASMFGGIPNIEISNFDNFWKIFNTLNEELFNKINDSYSTFKNVQINQTVWANKQVNDFLKKYSNSLTGFDVFLIDNLIKNSKNVYIPKQEELISSELFARISKWLLIDKYDVYQLMHDIWKMIAIDLEMIQTEGIECCRIVEPITEMKKDKDGKLEEVTTKFERGRIIPFELIQTTVLKDELEELSNLKTRLDQISQKYEEIYNNVSDDDKETYKEMFKDDDGGFVNKEIAKYAKELKKIKHEKTKFEKDILTLNKLIEEEKQIKKQIKDKTSQLNNKTKKIIQNLTTHEINKYLEFKWISPIISNIKNAPIKLVNNFIDNLNSLKNKYAITLTEIDSNILSAQNTLIDLIKDLKADDFDEKGLKELSILLGDSNNE